MLLRYYFLKYIREESLLLENNTDMYLNYFYREYKIIFDANLLKPLS